MVIDPVNAIGLASNFVQLIDFGRGLLCESRQICVSAAGSSVQHMGLGDTAETLLRLNDNTWQSLQSKGGTLTVDEQELGQLCDNCHRTALELLAALDKLRVGKGKCENWNSFRQAFKSVLKKMKSMTYCAICRSHGSSLIHTCWLVCGKPTRATIAAMTIS